MQPQNYTHTVTWWWTLLGIVWSQSSLWKRPPSPTVLPGKDCIVKSKNIITVGINPSPLFLFTFPSPPISRDMLPPHPHPHQKTDSTLWNDAGFPFGSQAASWVTDWRSCSDHTHADSLIDSTMEDSIVSVLLNSPAGGTESHHPAQVDQLSVKSVHTQQAVWLMTDRMI